MYPVPTSLWWLAANGRLRNLSPLRDQTTSWVSINRTLSQRLVWGFWPIRSSAWGGHAPCPPGKEVHYFLLLLSTLMYWFVFLHAAAVLKTLSSFCCLGLYPQIKGRIFLKYSVINKNQSDYYRGLRMLCLRWIKFSWAGNAVRDKLFSRRGIYDLLN